MIEIKFCKSIILTLIFLNSFKKINLKFFLFKPDQFFEWITEKYLKPINQTGIQLKFSSSSEIKLDKIFHVKLNL